jgi:hypothetical protein
MPVSILQSPTTPNVTGTNLVYTLSSSNAVMPQFRYVTDIYQSGSGDYLTTIKTYTNLSLNAVLDVSRELDDQLDYDLNWQVTGSIQPVQSVKTFDLRFGEEYAQSVTGSITLYTGSTPNYLEVFPGEVYKNEGSFNFNTSSFTTGTYENPYLTNCPAAYSTPPLSGGAPNIKESYLVNTGDYLTLTMFYDNFTGPGPSNEIRIGGYKAENGVSTFVTSSFLYWQVAGGEFETAGVGPQNLSEWDSGWAASIANGDINYIITAGDPGGVTIIINDKWDGVPMTFPGYGSILNETQKQCSTEYTRFAFINQYGFWDYYNVYNPLRSNNQVDRSLYGRSFVRYEDTIGSYNISNRGTTQYRTEYNKRYKITTDFIDQRNSQWLTELFESPEVFIQKNGQFVPINITNRNIRWNMNQYREKLFQYDIEFKYANQPQPR